MTRQTDAYRTGFGDAANVYSPGDGPPESLDVLTADYLYSHAWDETPEAERPSIAAAWAEGWYHRATLEWNRHVTEAALAAVRDEAE